MMDYRASVLDWLRGQFEEAKKENRAEYMWCLDLKKEEDCCLALEGTGSGPLTVEQVRDEIEKKKLPLLILRRFTTSVPFEAQVMDL